MKGDDVNKYSNQSKGVDFSWKLSIEGGVVLIDDVKIEALLRELPAEHDFRVFDFPESIICTRFIDVHVLGANGHDTMDGTYKILNGMSRYLGTTGTTSFLSTTVRMECSDIPLAIKVAKEAKKRNGRRGNTRCAALRPPI